MNASQNNFPRSRRFSYIALTLGLVSTVAISVALVQVDALEREYGTVRSDIQRYNSERTEALSRRDSVLSEISQRSVETDGIRKTIADLTAQRDRLDAEIKQQTASLTEGVEKLRANQEQSKAATDTIAEAAKAKETLATLRSQNAEIEKLIAANQAKVDQSNADVVQAEDRKSAADNAVASSEKVQRDKEAEIAKLNEQLQELDDKERQVADLTARQATLTAQITKVTKDIADKQRASQDLDATIVKLQDQASKAKILAAKTDADMARQDSNRADLADQVSALESRKASLNGDLTSLTASADRARSDAAAADGKLKAAQDALAEAEKSLPTAKAQLSDVQAEVAVVRTQRDSLKLEVSNLQALQAKSAVDKADFDRASAERVAIEKAVADLSNRQAQMAKELELRQNDLNTVRAELANLNGRKGVLVQEIADLSDAKTPKGTEEAPAQPAVDASAVAQPQTTKP